MEQAIPEQTSRRYTVAEYFSIDGSSDHKNEYRRGEIVAMAGGTEAHSLISMNVGGELRNRLRNTPCPVYDSNLRVRVKRSVRYAYPDALVVCGDRQFDPDDASNITIVNPKLVVEVLSPATELSDRSEKFDLYLQSETLEEYVLIAQDKARLQSFFRHTDGTWSMAHYVGLTAIARLRSLQIDLPLSEVYAKVDLPVVVEQPGEI